MTYTRPHWPEYQHPTAVQWRWWFLQQTPEDQVKLAQAALDAHEAQYRCFIGNHDNQLKDLDRTYATLWRYRMAWLSARRRGIFRMKARMERIENFMTLPVGGVGWIDRHSLNLTPPFYGIGVGAIIRTHGRDWKILDLDDDRLKLMLLRINGR